MIHLVLACCGVGLWSRLTPPLRTWVGVAAVATVHVPLAGVAAISAIVGRTARRRGRSRREREAAERDVTLLGELLLLGLTAGRPFLDALSSAAQRLPQGSVKRDAAATVRAAAAEGAEHALATTSSGPAAGLLTAVAGATVSGVSIVDAVSGFVTDRRRSANALRLASARRLPVRLTVPLALLMLPGLIVLTVAPAVIGAIDRLAS